MYRYCLLFLLLMAMMGGFFWPVKEAAALSCYVGACPNDVPQTVTHQWTCNADEACNGGCDSSGNFYGGTCSAISTAGTGPGASCGDFCGGGWANGGPYPNCDTGTCTENAFAGCFTNYSSVQAGTNLACWGCSSSGGNCTYQRKCECASGTTTTTSSGDTTPPTATLSIIYNGSTNPAYVNGQADLNISGTDNVGVTGWIWSTNPATPTLTSPYWNTVLPASANWSKNPATTAQLSDGPVTIYVWLRDAAGNISPAASVTTFSDTIGPYSINTAPTTTSASSNPRPTWNWNVGADRPFSTTQAGSGIGNYELTWCKSADPYVGPCGGDYVLSPFTTMTPTSPAPPTNYTHTADLDDGEWWFFVLPHDKVFLSPINNITQLQLKTLTCSGLPQRTITLRSPLNHGAYNFGTTCPRFKNLAVGQSQTCSVWTYTGHTLNEPLYVDCATLPGSGLDCAQPSCNWAVIADTGTAQVNAQSYNDDTFNGYSPGGYINIRTTPTLSYAAYVNNTNQNAFYIYGFCAYNNSAVSVTIGTQGFVTTCLNNSWSLSPNLSNNTIYPNNSALSLTASQTRPSGTTATGTGSTFKNVTSLTVSITAKPPALTNSALASFSFSSNNPAAALQCQLNSGSVSNCTSPKSYSSAAPDPLLEGANTFLVSALDTYGNTANDTYTWTLDTTPPTITITNPDNTVISTSKTVTATASDGTFQKVVLAAGDTNCSPTTTGFISVSNPNSLPPSDSSALNQNGQSVCYRAFDAAANYSYKQSVAVSNIQAHVISGSVSITPSTPSNAGYSTSRQVTLNLTANGGNGITGYWISESSSSHSSINPTNPNTPTCSSPISWGSTVNSCWQTITSTTTLSSSVNYLFDSDGGKTIVVWFRDSVGNYVLSDNYPFVTVDTIPPVISFTSLPAYYNVYRTASYAGTCEATLPLTLIIGTLSIPLTCNSGIFSVNVNLDSQPEGLLTVSLIQSDKAGNQTTVTASTFKDTIPPTTPVFLLIDPSFDSGMSNTDGITNLNVNPKINWGTSTDSGSGLNYYALFYTPPSSTTNYQAPATTTTSYTHTITLSEGTWVHLVMATDRAGNTSDQATLNVVVDLTAPLVTLTSFPAVNASNQGNLALSGACGTLTNDLSTINLTVKDKNNVTVTKTGTCTLGTWSIGNINVSSLAEGNLHATATQTDRAGNVGSSDNDVASTKDQTKDTITVGSFTINPFTSGVGGSQGCSNEGLPYTLVSWTQATNATSYQVFRYKAGVLDASSPVLPDTTTSWADSGPLIPHYGSYSYSVQAISAGDSRLVSLAANSTFWCDYSAPHSTISGISNNNCYTSVSWPASITATATDYPSPATAYTSGIASVSFLLTDTSATPPTSTTYPATGSGSSYSVSIPTSSLSLGHFYQLSVKTLDNADNPTPGVSGTPPNASSGEDIKNFDYESKCIPPWIQVSGGDVHSNGEINVPGGP